MSARLGWRVRKPLWFNCWLRLFQEYLCRIGILVHWSYFCMACAYLLGNFNKNQLSLPFLPLQHSFWIECGQLFKRENNCPLGLWRVDKTGFSPLSFWNMSMTIPWWTFLFNFYCLSIFSANIRPATTTTLLHWLQKRYEYSAKMKHFPSLLNRENLIKVAYVRI